MFFPTAGLRVPPSCELVVGGEPQCWSEGSCLLFDDSFLHRAFHEGKEALKGLNDIKHIRHNNIIWYH